MLPGVSAVEVTLVANGRKYRLGSDVVTVPASQIVLAVRGASGPVRLDGTTKHLDSTGGILPLDLRRSTGYHRLTVKGDDYWFATDDAKAKLSGVEEMLADLRGFGTGWTGQIAFSDGTGVRDPHVVYSWLDRRADSILAAAREILRSPRTEQVSRRALSRRGGAGVDVPATVRLLRSEPSRFLEEHATGVITVDERHYMPQRVVVRRRHSSIDTSANRRVIRLIAALRRLANEVYEYTDVRAQETQCLKWRNDADRLLSTGVGQRLLRFSGLADPSARSLIEDTDHRYELTFRMHQEVFDQFGWSPTSGHQSRSSYVKQADQIYQAYCASVIAQEFGMTQTHAVLGSSQPAFEGNGLVLYFDTPPPPEVLCSWRAFSTRPDQSRPDVLLHREATGEVAIVDAKYRADGDEATEDSRKEVSAYMALYGLNQIGIAFPSRGATRTVEGMGRRIVAIPLRPPVAGQGSIRAAVERLFAVPPFSKPKRNSASPPTAAGSDHQTGRPSSDPSKQ